MAGNPVALYVEGNETHGPAATGRDGARPYTVRVSDISPGIVLPLTSWLWTVSSRLVSLATGRRNRWGSCLDSLPKGRSCWQVVCGS